jgi:lipoyl(octanoyl) transferase
MYKCEVRELGRIEYGNAFDLQQRLVEQRKRSEVADQLLLLEHPHTITLGRNGHLENLLGSEPALRAAGIAFHATDRGGDITYHGPGQADFGIAAERVPGCTGAWVNGRKIGAIGVHLSRWVTSHGFALNVTTNLSYFGYIVPCGLAKPVTSMAQLGVHATLPDVNASLAGKFGRQFDREILELVLETS